jgi:hypothetical protein
VNTTWAEAHCCDIFVFFSAASAGEAKSANATAPRAKYDASLTAGIVVLLDDSDKVRDGTTLPTRIGLIKFPACRHRRSTPAA